MQTNQSRARSPQTPPLLGCHTLGYLPPALIVPGPGAKQAGTALIPQSPLTDKLVYPAWPVPSTEATIKASVGIPSASLLSSPGASPGGPPILSCPFSWEW